MLRKCLLMSLLGVLPACVLPAWGVPEKPASPSNGYFVYVADYSQQASHGIYAYHFDTATGKMRAMGKEADVVSPSFLATDPQHRFLYAATDKEDDPKQTGSITSFSINPVSGHLTLLNKVEVNGDPCHLVVDKTSRILFAANFNTGTVVSFALARDGRIGASTGYIHQTASGPTPERQTSAHAHEVVLSPDNRFLFVPNLGGDQISIYRVDQAKRSFSANVPAFASVAPGLGPRHFVFAPGGKFAYVVNEIGSSVVTFAYNAADGALTPLQTLSTLPEGFTGHDDSAEIEIDRAGRFLYASNRGHDSIAVFAVDPHSGILKKVQVAPTLGKTPRNFALDPTGKYLLAANQLSGNLVLFDVDAKSGQLQPAGQTVQVSNPVSIVFVPRR